MTKEQKEEFLQYLENLKLIQADDFYREGFDMAISALKGGWIPINDIEDIPKSGSYWVTTKYIFSNIVEKIRWSDTWRCWVDDDDDEILSKSSASLITAYMPYVVPEPYKKGE